MKKICMVLIALLLMVCLSACSGDVSETQITSSEAVRAEDSEQISEEKSSDISDEASTEEESADGVNEDDAEDAIQPVDTADPTEELKEEENAMRLKINDTEVNVQWEDNESVDALMEIVKEGELTVSMSMYGGFEQVGSLGRSLPRNDRQTTTDPGDIVLYSGNQMVVFYGSNSWSYTRLGHVTDKSDDEMAALLGNGDVTITITWE